MITSSSPTSNKLRWIVNIRMIRLIQTLAVWMSLATVVSASLTPRKDLPPLGKAVPSVPASILSIDALEQVAGRETEPEFVVTNQTEVLLNGKACRYEEVPSQARIVRMEVAADTKTVLKIHFRTRK